MNTMRALMMGLLVSTLPYIAGAQSSPVADAFKKNAQQVGKNIMQAAEDMPAAKYTYRPTAPQMTWAAVVVHLAEGNDYLCGKIAGTTAPTRAKIDTTAGKEALVARLRETFQFCDQSLASLDDSKLGEQIPFFGGKPWTRAAIMTLTTADWADHYSQMANYLRLNNLLPPTAKKAGM
jgi:uncharacterized damage-inducible protein DinB